MDTMRQVYEAVEKNGERAGMCVMLRLWADSLRDAMLAMPLRTKVETSAALRADWEAALLLVQGKVVPALPDTTHPGWDRLEADIVATPLPVAAGDQDGERWDGLS